MWWTNHTSQIWRKKKKIPGTLRRVSDSSLSEAGALYSAFLISKWGFTLRTMGLYQKSVERLSMLTKRRQLRRTAQSWASAAAQHWQFE